MSMHTNLRGKWVAGVAAAGLAALTLTGCGSLSESSSSSSAAGGGPCAGVEAGSVDPKALDGVTVKVGSKEFDEQLVLGQLTIKMMCAAGADGEGRDQHQGQHADPQEAPSTASATSCGSTPAPAGSTTSATTKPITDPQAQYEAVKKEDLAKNKLVWGPLAPFNNTYAFAVTDEFGKDRPQDALRHGGLHQVRPGATVCVESEFAARPDGYPGFKKTYGITGGKLKSLGTGVVYTQLDKGNCDFGEIFTTDGRLAALGLQILDDDKGYFPLYNGVAVTRADFDEEHPEMLEVLKPLADSLDTETMTQLNKKISSDGLPADKIAEDYLTEQGYLK